MHRRVAAVLLTGVLFALFFLSAPAQVDAQDEEERLAAVEREIRDLQRQIEEAEAERSEYADQLAETQARMDALLQVLGEAEAALTSIQSDIGGKEADIADLQRKVRILQAQIAETQLEQRSTRSQIRVRAVELYMNGSLGLSGVVFGVDDVQSASVSLEYAGNLVEDTGILLRGLEVLENQEASQERRIEDEKSREEEILAGLQTDRLTAEQHRATVDASRVEIQIELDAQEALLAELNAEIADYESHTGALEAESRQIELEIARRQIREGSAPGRLAWPVPGPVTSAFGWRVHPIYGNRRLHAGIDLEAATGDRIWAAGNGTVIMATTWGGYGRTVIIDHGGGLSSLYAHQSSINVSLGQQVSAGDVIGYAGASGNVTGAHLHFETREFGTPVDPMKYLNG